MSAEALGPKSLSMSTYTHACISDYMHKAATLGPKSLSTNPGLQITEPLVPIVSKPIFYEATVLSDQIVCSLYSAFLDIYVYTPHE
jgi:hypothetical protein